MKTGVLKEIKHNEGNRNGGKGQRRECILCQVRGDFPDGGHVSRGMEEVRE